MGGLFSKPKKPKLPPVPAPAPIPETGGPEEEEYLLQGIKKRSGIRKAFITGNVSPMYTGKKTTLG